MLWVSVYVILTDRLRSDRLNSMQSVYDDMKKKNDAILTFEKMFDAFFCS